MSKQINSPKEQPKQGMGKRGGGGGIAPAEKAKDFKGTVKKLFKYISKYKIAIILVVIFSIGSTIFTIVGPKILGNATTEIANGVMSKFTGGSGIDFPEVGKILLWVMGLYGLSAFLGYIQGLVMTQVSQKVGYNIRKDISKKINVLPMKYFDERQTGDVLSVITNDIDTLTTGLNQSATQLITSITTIVGVLIMMFSINVLMTIVALLILPISAILISFIMKRSQRHFIDQQDYLGDANGQIEETFSGINVVQVFNNQKQSIKKFEDTNKDLYDSSWKSQFFSGIMMPIMQFIGNLGYVVISVLGGYLAITGTITVGNIQSFIQYVRQFTQPIQQLAQVSNMMQSTIAASERIFDFLEAPEESQYAKNPAKMEVVENGVTKLKEVTEKDIIGNVKFDHVKFGYTEDKMIVNDFNVDVDKNQTVAIVGPTGGGKTTVIMLLMRFYDLNGGAIYIDGHDITDFDRNKLREMFGMVLQDTWLFSGTIMENIRYGRLDATDEEVYAAAKAAHAHRFIKTLSDGYDTVLNEDATNISQGQKQLLTIARTILSNPKILILDEATSSVDTRTEIQIKKAMDNLMKNRTSFIIAHRLSTIRDADTILVLKDGDIIERGNHEELIVKKGFYYDLYNSQFENVS